jgi:hypothetical protein
VVENVAAALREFLPELLHAEPAMQQPLHAVPDEGDR